MNYLLDTQVFLWILSAPHRLEKGAREAIRNPERSVFLSAVSGVEIAIKKTIGKLEAPEDLWTEAKDRGLLELPLKFIHGEAMERLPAIHSDPFDRMLITQAMVEELTIITHDRKFDGYGVKVLWS